MADELVCASCGAVNLPGRKFCGECGSALELACPSCGAPNPPTVKFCGECGSPLAAADASPTRQGPAAERRLVSILFADLVGHTTASEGRDAEDTRELLSSYFETARTLVERYGGAVEKFIGDAVMAVWGTPVAQEDDAERAVRAALDLVAAVPALDAGLRARAGVLTGEAAVTLGAEGQGMVAGDLVNTASRIQSAAEPGTVLVGEATKRASEAAVAYEDAGEHALKGKAEQVRLWRPLRVVANRGGEGRATTLEAPFVGRDREFRLVQDLFHAAGDDRRATLVTVIGVAGIGKSRLAWELEKHIDGLADVVWWHRGRCLAYGEGVAFWALAEMVRMRGRISEDDTEDVAVEKLAATVGEQITDAGEREWVEPLLRDLLGLGQLREVEWLTSSSAWRPIVERMSDAAPESTGLRGAARGRERRCSTRIQALARVVVCAADLRARARTSPELLERRGDFGAHGGSNDADACSSRLADDAMDELLDEFVPGLLYDPTRPIREARRPGTSLTRSSNPRPKRSPLDCCVLCS